MDQLTSFQFISDAVNHVMRGLNIRLIDRKHCWSSSCFRELSAYPSFIVLRASSSLKSFFQKKYEYHEESTIKTKTKTKRKRIPRGINYAVSVAFRASLLFSRSKFLRDLCVLCGSEFFPKKDLSHEEHEGHKGRTEKGESRKHEEPSSAFDRN